MKKLILFFIVFFGIITGYSQNRPSDIKYEYHDGVKFCKYDPAKNRVNSRTKKMPGLLKLLLHPNARMSCGNIRLTFLDETNTTGTGFNDATLGPIRRQSVCEVMTYIQSVIKFPASITPANPIDILIDSQNLPGDTTLGFASPSYPNTFPGTPGYYGGFVYDFITSGNNPALTVGPAGVMEHGRITMNFGQRFSYSSSSPSTCEYDFHSVILHEFTHLLSVGSFMTEDPTTKKLISLFGPNIFTPFDQKFLWYYNGSGFDKMVDETLFASNGGINPALPASMFNSFETSNKVWLDNTTFDNRTNQPVNSRLGGFSNGTTLSHFDENYWIRTYQSPAFSPNYLMNGNLNTGTLKNKYTKEELHILQRLGYVINTIPNYTNQPPNINGNVIREYGWGVDGPSGVQTAEEPFPAGNNNLVIATTNCQPVIIDIGTNTITAGSVNHTLGISDFELNPISVYNGQLFNLRGCGNVINNTNGNNNAQLEINSTNNVITFRPRTNFIGRAQFAFNLFDGIDRGAYVVITIDVTADTCFKNGDAGIEHVINGGLEDGMLVRHLDTPNNLIVDNLDLSYNYINSQRFCDGQEYIHSGMQDQVVKNSNARCIFPKIGEMFGSYPESFPSPGGAPTPKNDIGDRYTTFAYSESFHQRLNPPLSKCHNYKFSIDVNFNTSQNVPLGTTIPLIITLRNTMGGADLVNIPATLTHDGTWQTINLDISYSDPLPANFIFINPHGFGYCYVDNISIVDDIANPFTPSTMTSPSTATICNYGTINIPLTSDIPSTYTWVAAENPNTTGESTTLQSSGIINDTIINTTTTVQTVVYTVTPTSTGGCPGNIQTVTITIDPTCIADCPANLVFSTPEGSSTAKTYRASNTIITQTNYINNTTLTIEMLAGTFVDLLDGTEIKLNADFLADIENCDGTGRQSNTPQQRTVESQEEQSKSPIKEKETNKITIFPNPNKGNFTVQFNSVSNKEVHIVVNDMSGRTIFDKKYNNTGVFSQNLQLDNIQAGIYLVTVQNGDRKEVKRIVVE